MLLASLALPPTLVAEGPGRCARMAAASEAHFTPPERLPQDAAGIAGFLAQWALALLNHGGGLLREARGWAEQDELHFALGYHNPRLSLAALELAVRLFATIDRASTATMASDMAAFERLDALGQPDYQARFLMQAARADGIPWLPLFPEHRLWRFGWGNKGRTFFESEPEGDSAIGWKAGRDKTAAKAIFNALGVRSAPHVLATSEGDLAKAARAIGWPCVVKPIAAGRGKGVTTDVASMSRLILAFREARKAGDGPVIIERQVEGDALRIMVVRGRTVHVVLRASPRVTGDGRRTLRQLVEAHNAPRITNPAPFVGPVPFDEELELQLARQDLSLDRVVPQGQVVLLRRLQMLSTGAEYRDVTTGIHPDIARMGELLAAAFGLEVCGIDFVTRDHTRSCAEEGAVLEINTTPSLRVPLVVGLSDVEIGRLVLGDGLGRIPATLVVAGEDDLARIANAGAFDGGHGWVIGERCGLGGYPLSAPGSGAESPPPATAELVARLLRNPLAASLTVACTPAQLAHAGLPVDRWDRVIALPCDLDPAWREVLERHSPGWIDAAGAPEALALLATDPG